MLESDRSERLDFTGGIVAVALVLYLSSLQSYLLFHSLIEIVTIAIAFTLFILAWHSRSYSDDGYLSLLGIGYGFIALIDLLHTLAYKGMNIFPEFGANQPTQFWIAARYLQAVTLVVAPLLVKRKVNNYAVVGGFAVAVSVLVAMIYSGNFPDCFVEGKGLTPFKIGSEYLITVVLFVSLYLFCKKRSCFNSRVFFLVAASIVCTALSEISFTTYVSVYGFANMLGHFAKLAAFYLIYRAILVTGLEEPFALVFRNYKEAEEALRESRDSLEERVRERTTELHASEKKYRSLIQDVPTAIVLHDGRGHLLDSNPLAQRLLRLSADQLLGKALIAPEWHFLCEDGSVMPVTEYPVSRVLSTRRPLRDYVVGISSPERDDVTWVLVNGEPEYEATEDITLVIVSFVDITERKRADEALVESEARYRRIVDTSGEGIWMVDDDINTSFVNTRMAEMLGYSSEEMIGRPFTSFMFEEDVSDHLLKIEHRRQGRSESYERRFRCKNGQTVWTLVSATPVTDDKYQYQGSFAMFTDITERKSAEETLRRRNKELERFEKLVVGRELRMMELKSRITQLEEALARCEENHHES